MADVLVACMQALCILGLLCGAWYSITYGLEDADALPARNHEPLTTHAWDATDETVLDART